MKRRNKKSETKISAATMIGTRNENQDNFRIDFNIDYIENDCFARCILENDKAHFVCVCDGIGGGVEGRENAIIVCQNLGTHLKEGDIITSDNIIGQFMNAIDKVQTDVQDHLKEKNGVGGCTMVVLAWIDKCYYTFSIGDSSIYRYDSKSYITLLNERQNVKNHFMKTSRECPKEEENQLMNYLGRIGVEGSEMTHISQGKIKKKDVFVLCSDGVASIGEKEIALALSKGENARQIVEKAADRENADNCTAIVLEM